MKRWRIQNIWIGEFPLSSDTKLSSFWNCRPNSQPGRSSSRIPDIPMEPVPISQSIRISEPVKIVKFEEPKPTKKIISRSRPIEKLDAQIQTDEVEEEVQETERTEKIVSEIFDLQ